MIRVKIDKEFIIKEQEQDGEVLALNLIYRHYINPELKKNNIETISCNKIHWTKETDDFFCLRDMDIKENAHFLYLQYAPGITGTKDKRVKVDDFELIIEN